MTNSILKYVFLSETFLVCLLSLIANTTVSAADIESGKRVYSQACLSCHGSAAQGNTTLGSPALAGQNKAYLLRQLNNFSTGVRGSDKSDTYGQQMAAMMAQIKDSESQENVSSYLASLDKPNASITEGKTGGGSKLGYKIYQASCGACHGADGSGNERLNSPSLVGLSSAYLSRQYTNFLDGKRGSHKSDKLGRQMRMIANTVTKKEKIDAAIAYLISLRD